VLLDIIMPKLDGGDVLLLLRQDPDLHKVPVIMLTALLSEHDEEWRTDEADQEMGFLSKPIDMDMLVGTSPAGAALTLSPVGRGTAVSPNQEVKRNAGRVRIAAVES